MERLGQRRRLRPVDSAQSAVIRVDGRDAVNFSSNNYLGLAADPRLLNTDSEDGFGAGASRLTAGSLRPHRLLETRLAEIHEAPAALLFNSGYQANVGVISALAGPEDVIFSDELNHASIIDGCRLSRARVEVFPHRDVAALDLKLGARTPARRRFIITDSVFSMDGDLAPLVAERQVADRYGAVFIIDEAHATGIRGPAGRGLAAELGVQPDVHLATLSKALGTFGAYVTGPRSLADYLSNLSRSFVFSTALPTSVVTASLTSLSICSSAVGDDLRRRLDHRVAQFRTGLATLDLLGPHVGQTPIFPIVIGDEVRTMSISDRLLAAGVFAQGIRPPTVPRGTARLRFALMATHTPTQIDRALTLLADFVREGSIPRIPHA